MPDQDDNTIVLETIDDAIADVRAATDLAEYAKDGLVGQLRAARHAVNGAQDKVQALAELVAIRTVAEARQAVLLPSQIREQTAALVKAHIDACAGAKVPPQVDPTSKLGIFLACIKSWPLAIVAIVALIAPNAAPIIDKIGGIAEYFFK